MNKQELKDILKGVALGVVLAVTGSVMAAWSEPTQAPTGGNADAPINVSNTGQTKGGNLVVNNNNQNANGLIVPFGAIVAGNVVPAVGLKIHVVGKTGSDQFCNTKEGANRKCVTLEDLCQKLGPNVCTTN